jgi:hypothetical protein
MAKPKVVDCVEIWARPALPLPFKWLKSLVIGYFRLWSANGFGGCLRWQEDGHVGF